MHLFLGNGIDTMSHILGSLKVEATELVEGLNTEFERKKNLR